LRERKRERERESLRLIDSGVTENHSDIPGRRSAPSNSSRRRPSGGTSSCRMSWRG
jgi:hypothetical protein